MNKPDGLYYITHIDNVPSILEKGILPRSQAQETEHRDIHDPEVLSRSNKPLPSGKMLQDCVSLYFQPRNAMLYRLVCNIGRQELAVLQVKPQLIEQAGTVFSDRAVSASSVQLFTDVGDLEKIDGGVFVYKYWSDSDGTKHKMMAEVLVPRPIHRDEIVSIYVSAEPHDELKKLAGAIDVVPKPQLFFAPLWQTQVTDTISLAQGDMFFSSMQTFAVSVNLQGIMGKGLAARTKYQFPDAYVRYQDDCRNHRLKINRPTLFKRGISIEEELADDRTQLQPEKVSSPRWFLFLPSKRTWHERSYYKNIGKSMQWLLDNYKEEGIQSIALPSLSCGSGNLSWQNIGPMVCRYLNHMDIQCCLYLPAEEMPDKQWFEKSYLLDPQRQQPMFDGYGEQTSRGLP